MKMLSYYIYEDLSYELLLNDLVNTPSMIKNLHY